MGEKTLWMRVVQSVPELLIILLAYLGQDALPANAGTIFPGERVDEFRVTERKCPQGSRGGVPFGSCKEEEGGGVKLTVTSPDFAVVGSQLRVNRSTLEDVVRYFGKGDLTTSGETLVMSYRAEGIEFEVNRETVRVKAISIFPPVRDAKIPKEQFPQFKK